MKTINWGVMLLFTTAFHPLFAGPIEESAIGRQQWSASPVKAGKDAQYKPQTEIKYISIHHTTSKYATPQWNEKKLLEFVQDYHQNGSDQRGRPLKYRDIAYHYIVSDSGNIFRGRALDRAPASATHYLSVEELSGATFENGIVKPQVPVEADVPGNTEGHITVSFRHGLNPDGTKQTSLLSDAAMNNAATLVAELLVKYGLTPKDVRAHREIASGDTNCPSDVIYKWLRGDSMSPEGVGPGMLRIKSEYRRLKD